MSRRDTFLGTLKTSLRHLSLDMDTLLTVAISPRSFPKQTLLSCTNFYVNGLLAML